jgi:putative mycofactocin binding protein MftB
VTLSAPVDLDAAWDISPRVSVRPEPFGALLYHFGTRKLSFLKDRMLLQIVTGLADAPSARAACEAVGVSETDLPKYARALDTLVNSAMLVQRQVPPTAERNP